MNSQLANQRPAARIGGDMTEAEILQELQQAREQAREFQAIAARAASARGLWP
jgi:hypothetical protein